jgi:hypothetical protein
MKMGIKDVAKALWWWPILFFALFLQIQLGCVPAKKPQPVVEEPLPSITGIVTEVSVHSAADSRYQTIQIEFEDGTILITAANRYSPLVFKKDKVHVVEYDNAWLKRVTVIEEE